MRVAFIVRSSFYKIHGGSGVQVTETAKELRNLGIHVSIYLTHERIPYADHDMLHFFDITRPANILCHIKRSNLPFVLTPILVDYGEYDRKYRKGISGFIFRLFSASTNEYLKTTARWLLGRDSLCSESYLWKGQTRSIREVLSKASMILPNSQSEWARLTKTYKLEKPYLVVPNGIDQEIFSSDPGNIQKENNLVVCAARIEGIKNQLNLIKALNNSAFTLLLIGEPSGNQSSYYEKCRQLAAGNVHFMGKIPQSVLVDYYEKAKVHVLPSWFETCGLSSLEAAAMGCNIVVSNRGFTRDYFEDLANYCEPGDPQSIYKAIDKAANSPVQPELKKRILQNYSWKIAASKTLEAYKLVMKQ